MKNGYAPVAAVLSFLLALAMPGLPKLGAGSRAGLRPAVAAAAPQLAQDEPNSNAEQQPGDYGNATGDNEQPNAQAGDDNGDSPQANEPGDENGGESPQMNASPGDDDNDNADQNDQDSGEQQNQQSSGDSQ
jgi:hypothetical protein